MRGLRLAAIGLSVAVHGGLLALLALHRAPQEASPEPIPVTISFADPMNGGALASNGTPASVPPSEAAEVRPAAGPSADPTATASQPATTAAAAPFDPPVEAAPAPVVPMPAATLSEAPPPSEASSPAQPALTSPLAEAAKPLPAPPSGQEAPAPPALAADVSDAPQVTPSDPALAAAVPSPPATSDPPAQPSVAQDAGLSAGLSAPAATLASPEIAPEVGSAAGAAPLADAPPPPTAAADAALPTLSVPGDPLLEATTVERPLREAAASTQAPTQPDRHEAAPVPPAGAAVPLAPPVLSASAAPGSQAPPVSAAPATAADLEQAPPGEAGAVTAGSAAAPPPLDDAPANLAEAAPPGPGAASGPPVAAAQEAGVPALAPTDTVVAALETGVAADQIRAFVDGYDGGACFYAALTHAARGEAEIDSFSPTVERVETFHTAFMGALGLEPDVTGQRVWSAQCPAVDFLRQARRGGAPPVLALDRRDLRSGEVLAGSVRNTGGRPVGLFLVSETGAVDDLSGALRDAPGGKVFALPLRHEGQGGPFPQLLVAVAGEASLPRAGGSAAQVFRPDAARAGLTAAAKLFLISRR